MADVTPREKPGGSLESSQFDNRIEEMRNNKAHQTKRTEDGSKRDISVDLDDINEAIKYYFDNEVLPKVYNGTELTEVPVLYGNKERWASIQKDGYLRDKKGSILLPAIVYKRTGLTKSDKLPIDKLDENLKYYFARKYSPRNRYDRFSVQQGLNKTRELHEISVPDYYDINYEVVIFTDYVAHMNKLIEAVQYNEGRYWGRPDKFKFKVAIDSYDENINLDQNSNRLVSTQFQMNVFGYLIPETKNNETNAQKRFTVQTVEFGEETVKSLDEIK